MLIVRLINTSSVHAAVNTLHEYGIDPWDNQGSRTKWQNYL